MDKKYIACVSWGKDSTAMVWTILENFLPLDEVVFYDTGVEFEGIYKTRDFMSNVLKIAGVKYTELKPTVSFFDNMFNVPHKKRTTGEIYYGYGWCGGACRWGTGEKLRILKSYCKDAIQYVGIAYDEPVRYARLTDNKIAPLYDNKITEKMALDICYSHGIYFDNLYKHLDRASCWCCRNKNLKELKAYKDFYPEYFNKLVEIEEKLGEPMKKPYFLKERFGGVHNDN